MLICEECRNSLHLGCGDRIPLGIKFVKERIECSFIYVMDMIEQIHKDENLGFKGMESGPGETDLMGEVQEVKFADVSNE